MRVSRQGHSGRCLDVGNLRTVGGSGGVTSGATEERGWGVKETESTAPVGRGGGRPARFGRLRRLSRRLHFGGMRRVEPGVLDSRHSGRCMGEGVQQGAGEGAAGEPWSGAGLRRRGHPGA